MYTYEYVGWHSARGVGRISWSAKWAARPGRVAYFPMVQMHGTGENGAGGWLTWLGCPRQCLGLGAQGMVRPVPSYTRKVLAAAWQPSQSWVTEEGLLMDLMVPRLLVDWVQEFDTC